jgi:hypothetical protein
MSALVHQNRLNIVICTKDRFDECFSLLRSLEYQILRDSLQNYVRVVIIDNGSKVANAFKLRRIESLLSNTLILNLRFSGLSLSRNVAIRLCDEKDFIYYLDDDIKLINPNFLTDLISLINLHSPDLIGGPVHAKLPLKMPYWFNSDWLIRKHHGDGFGTERLSGGNFGFDLNKIPKALQFDENLGMKGRKVRLGEEKDFVERYLLAHTIPRIFYSSKLIVEEEFDTHKLSFRYRMRREFAVGYAGHANHEHEISKKLFSSLITLSYTDLRKAFIYSKINFRNVLEEMQFANSSKMLFLYLLALSRSFGFFMRKIRWRI